VYGQYSDSLQAAVNIDFDFLADGRFCVHLITPSFCFVNECTAEAKYHTWSICQTLFYMPSE
jgi:hypothetical protein